MKKQKGFSLIGVLLIVGALVVTAGGVVLRNRSFPQPNSNPESSLPVAVDESIRSLVLPAAQTLTGTWKLIAYKNLITGETETEPEDIGRSIVIKFVDDGQYGKLEGHTIINSVSGDYEVSNGNKIKVLRFGGSKVGEGWAWGYKFWNAIRQSSSYQITDDSLLLYFDLIMIKN